MKITTKRSSINRNEMRCHNDEHREKSQLIFPTTKMRKESDDK